MICGASFVSSGIFWQQSKLPLHPRYRITREVGDVERTTMQFPEDTRNLLDGLTTRILSQPLYELPQKLIVVVEALLGVIADI